jgi:hypothetical protein
MLLLEGYNSNFTRARYYFLCVEFSNFYVNQSLAGQTKPNIIRGLPLCREPNLREGGVS